MQVSAEDTMCRGLVGAGLHRPLGSFLLLVYPSVSYRCNRMSETGWMAEIGDLLSFGTYVLRVSCPPHTMTFFHRESKSKRDRAHFSSSALCDKDVNSVVAA